MRQTACLEFILRLGDNALINAQRLSEWCGHAPFLEEDIAMANTALDLIGRARLLLSYAGEVEGEGRTEDDFAYYRDVRDWRNFLIMELPRGDFGFTIARQLLVDVYDYQLYQQLLHSTDQTLAGIAAKTIKECDYHLRRSRNWTIRLAAGTAESQVRIQAGLDEVWPYATEFFRFDAVDEEMQACGIAPGLTTAAQHWRSALNRILAQTGLHEPAQAHSPDGGRQGLHTEHMGYLLAEMQAVPRAYPGLQW